MRSLAVEHPAGDTHWGEKLAIFGPGKGRTLEQQVWRLLSKFVAPKLESFFVPSFGTTFAYLMRVVPKLGPENDPQFWGHIFICFQNRGQLFAQFRAAQVDAVWGCRKLAGMAAELGETR